MEAAIQWLGQMLPGFSLGAIAAILLKSLGAAAATDVAKRIGWTIGGLRVFDSLTRWAVKDSTWSGKWEVVWHVKSDSFSPENSEQVELFRGFNRIGFVGSGTTTGGKKIDYGFVGNLSRDKSIATGIWFDKTGGGVGYHGAYQLRLNGTRTEARGKWIGFSETTSEIKADEIVWRKQ